MLFDTVVILFITALRRIVHLIASTLEHLVNYIRPAPNLSTTEPGMMDSAAVTEEFGNLNDKIVRCLVESKFTYNNGKMFLPLESLQSLLTKENIEKELSGASNELVDFIDQKAKRTFAIVLNSMVTQPKHTITSVMESCKNSGFDDKSLPIQKELLDGQLESCPDDCAGKHAPALEAFHHRILKRAISTFSEAQWTFLAPEFPLQKDRRTLHGKCILPFTTCEDYKREGGFSKVCKATLRVDHIKVMPGESRIVHPANSPNTHQNDQEGKSLGIDVAIKRFKPKQEHSPPVSEMPDPEFAWSREVDAMEEQSKLPEIRIVPLIGAFSIQGEYYIVTPWADGGTLEEFWKKDHNHVLSGDLIMEFLEQYLQIAESLCRLHRLEDHNERPEGGKTDQQINDIFLRVPQGNLPASPDVPEASNNTNPEGSNWRHGDLKPGNIFRKESGTALGTLMIGDVGLAKKHYNITHLRTHTDTRLGTIDYEPPEAFDNSHAKSRAYDIWSMGCIIVETIVWLLYGKRKLYEFYNRSSKNINGTRYYTVQSTFPERELDDTTSKWIDHILANDPECSGTKSTALKDLLNLAKKKLLVVKPPEYYENPNYGERTNASRLIKELRRIIDASKLDKAYLFTDANREGIEMPNEAKESQFQKV